jgi:hypothetical protein
MSAHSSVLPLQVGLPVGVDEIRTSSIGWAIFLVGLSCYCLLYELVVSQRSPDLAATLGHILHNWGVWPLTTPLVFAALRKYGARSKHDLRTCLRVGAVILAISVMVPVAIDLFTQARAAAISLVILKSLAFFLPRYIAVMVVAYLVWRVLLRERSVPASRPETVAAALDEASPPPATLLVSKGSDSCRLQVEHVECINAAGNYVEIVARGHCYLMRTTLKQIEAMLPASCFTRIHRSHIVNRHQIDRVRTQPSGNGTVHLRNGQVLKMSKKYKSELRKSRPTAG